MPSTAGRIHYKLAPGQPSFELAVPQGVPEFESPFGEAEPTALIIHQRMMQLVSAYARPPENQRCPPDIFPSAQRAFFVDDSPRQPLNVAGLCTFTRTWATRPAQVVEYDQIAVQIPARAAVFRFDIGTGGGSFNWYPYIAAKSYNLPRLVTILRDFFLIGAGPDAQYSSVANIPAQNETIYAGRDVTGLGTGPLSDDQYFGITAQNVGLFSGAILDPGGSSAGSGNTTYTASALSTGNYFVGQSRLRRYQGNIWERITTRITL